MTSFYASEDNEPHEYEALKILSDEEVKSIADDVFGSIVPDFDDVTHKNNTNSKN